MDAQISSVDRELQAREHLYYKKRQLSRQIDGRIADRLTKLTQHADYHRCTDSASTNPAKPAAKLAAKPSAKPAAKPVYKPAAKPAVQPAAANPNNFIDLTTDKPQGRVRLYQQQKRSRPPPSPLAGAADSTHKILWLSPLVSSLLHVLLFCWWLSLLVVVL